MKMTFWRAFAVSAFLLAAPLTLAACEEEYGAEEMGEEMGEGAEEAAEELDDAADEFE